MFPAARRGKLGYLMVVFPTLSGRSPAFQCGAQIGIWRLIAHHEDALRAVEEMKDRNRIAIGWSDTGDLRKATLSAASDISTLIARAYDGISNAHLGGPSLWNLYHEMKDGDMVILSANGKRRSVFQVIGPYRYERGLRQIVGYAHQRTAALTSIEPDRLWETAGSKVASDQNVRWTLAACVETTTARSETFREGARFSVTSTAIERNPRARAKCIDHFGCRCLVCGFDFEKVFGGLGRGYIHVHHKAAISTRVSEYEIDPVEDLVPLCPNCHAMAHQSAGISVEDLIAIYRGRQKVRDSH